MTSETRVFVAMSPPSHTELFAVFIKLDNFVLLQLQLEGFSTWQSIRACVTVTQVTMQTLFLMG